jgi:hypothetical protein
MELSFEKNLWGQYEKLHERLIKKITYYNNIHKIFSSIHSSFKDIMKKINQINIIIDPIIFPRVNSSKSEKSESEKSDTKYYGFPLIMKIIKEYLSESIDFNNQTLENVLNNIKTLIQSMNKEKNEYEEYINCLNSYFESKKNMEQNMKAYFQKSKAAEQSVYDLKKLEIKYAKINKDQNIIENITKMKENSINLVKDSLKAFKIYKDSLNKTNELREESIRLEKLLLYKFQNIEQETGKISTSIAFIFSSNHNIQEEISKKKFEEMENTKKSLNTNKDIKQLIIDFSGNIKPYEKHNVSYFDSFIDFDKCEKKEEYQIYLETILFIKNINKEEYPEFNKELEAQKNDMREVICKLFSKYTEENAQKLKNYIDNNLTHKYFLIILSKLRANNRFNLDIKLVNLLGNILNTILNNAEKNNIYNNAKNCLILSQTFFYLGKNNEKKYIFENIKNHKWLISVSFWENFIELEVNREIKSFLKTHNEITLEDIDNCSENLSDKLKLRLSEVLFSQLIAYVNNMNDLKLDKSIILQITDGFTEKYKFMTEAHLEAIYGLISDNKEEIKKLREKYKRKRK